MEMKNFGAVSEIIKVAQGIAKNVNMGLVEENTFDLELNTSISKITLQKGSKTKVYDYNNSNLGKAEISPGALNDTTVYIEYTITVKNIGDISGYVKKIVDYLPDELTFESNLNPDWYKARDGNLYSNKLSKKELEPNESIDIKLILTKKMTDKSTGLINNTSEIAECYNKYRYRRY